MTHEKQIVPQNNLSLRLRIAETIAMAVNLVESSGVYVSLQGGISKANNNISENQNE